MRIDYFYNEKLPKRTAHDSYVWRNCFYLSLQGLDVTLVTGPGESSLAKTHLHYVEKRIDEPPLVSGPFLPSDEPLPTPFLAPLLTQKMMLTKWQRLALGYRGESLLIGDKPSLFHWLNVPLLRKSRFFSMSWNLPFFWRCQSWIESHKPHWALFSVYKQAYFHLKQRVQGVRYLFEVQDLAWYPPNLQAHSDIDDIAEPVRSRVKMQRNVLQQCDFVTTTTHALKSILEKEPYNISTPIEVVPLASEHNPILPKDSWSQPILKPLAVESSLPLKLLDRSSPLSDTHAAAPPLTLGYVGQLYPHQGVDALIRALYQVEGINLEVIGGHERDLKRIRDLIEDKGMKQRVKLHGFVTPSSIPDRLAHVDVLAAPFYLTRHMRYVAHTKLADYGRWGLPVLAPHIEGIENEMRSTRFLFDAGDYPESLESLVQMLGQIKQPQVLKLAREEVDLSLKEQPNRFHWDLRCEHLKRLLDF